MKQHKTFNAYDKVLVKQCDDAVWVCKFYSHWIGDLYEHITTDGIGVADENIIPYEGNEHLVGSVDEPEEEVKLEEGEVIIAFDSIKHLPNLDFCTVRKFQYADNSIFYTNTNTWVFAIRFSDFNPNDMAETKKHILCVKNGKVVKYKG